MNHIVRRITATLFAAQSLASVGGTAALTIGTIAAARLSGEPAFAGLPTTLYLLGGALGAYPAGRFMDYFGRRRGLTLGFSIALLGSLLTVASLSTREFVWLLLGYSLMGLGRSAIDQGRFAAAEIVPPSGRARALSWFVLGGTVGGIFGPLFIGPSSRFALQLRFDELDGPFLATAITMALGGLIVFLAMRPDPREIARQLAGQSHDKLAAIEAPRPFREILAQYSVQLAMTAMVFGQIVMVVVMTITPLQMTDHNQSLDAVSLVIAAHIVGMYGLSVFTGRLADYFGRDKIIMAGACILSIACLVAPMANSTVLLAGALFLLGLGWNFCYVSGSSLLADALRPGERGRIQGTNDLVVGLTSAAGSLSSGILFATIGYAGIAAGGIAMAAALLVSSVYLGNLLFRPRVSAG